MFKAHNGATMRRSCFSVISSREKVAFYFQTFEWDADCTMSTMFDCLHRHALDVRSHYERKLERLNHLYTELSSVLHQLDLREQRLAKSVHTVIDQLCRKPIAGLGVVLKFLKF